MNLRTLTLIVEDDGSLRAARGEYVETDAAGRETSVGTKAIAEADLSSVLPTAASLIASVDALTSERDALVTERDGLAADVERLSTSETEKVARISELEASVSDLTSERDALASEVASLTQQVEALTPPPVDLPAQIKMECERRIYAVADANTQMNMVAAAIAGLLDDDGRAALSKAVQWVGVMRAACVALIAAEDETFQDGAHWPPCPPDVVALAGSF